MRQQMLSIPLVLISLFARTDLLGLDNREKTERGATSITGRKCVDLKNFGDKRKNAEEGTTAATACRQY